MQLGLDIIFHDPNTNELVPWAEPTKELLAEMANAPWKIDDIETTGLNPASKPQNFSPKELRRGIDNALRMRVASCTYPTLVGLRTVAFDFDLLTKKQRKSVAKAMMTNVVFAHNAGFDSYWLARQADWEVKPKKVLDSMLIARIMLPNQPILMANLATDENGDEELRAEAMAAFMGKRSGWSLADLVMTQLGVIMPKDLQGPKNWAQPFLTQQNYDYATGDTVKLHRLLCKLLSVPEGGDLLERYEELAAFNKSLKIVEPQVWDIVLMRKKGMPWDAEAAEVYVQNQGVKVLAQVETLVGMEPDLAKYKSALASMTDGVSAGLKDAVGQAFTRRGLTVDTTDKSGTFKIGEKDLRRAKAQLNPEAEALFNTWVGIQRAKKAGGMAGEVSGYAARAEDGRLHPNTGHGPVTGRLSSSEPNCFTGDTEILTPHGWVRFADLQPGMDTMQYNDGALEQVRPSDYIRSPWKGQLVHNQTQFTDLLTTPLHRCMVSGPAGDEVVMAKDYPVDRSQIHAAIFGGGTVAREMSDDELRHEVQQAMSSDAGGNPFGPHLWSLTRHQLDVMVEALCGSTVQQLSGSAKVVYTTANAARADWAQILLTLSGVNAVVSQVDGGWAVKAFGFNKTPTKDRKQSQQDFAGLVYCVTVPSGFIVVRRNGRVMVTGQCQQFPRDELFRACVRAREGYKIVASDYSALDMRVGAALAIRAQRQVFEAYMGGRQVSDDVLLCINRVLDGHITLEKAREAEAKAVQAFKKHKERREEQANGDGRKAYWDAYRRLQRAQLLARFTRCYKQVRLKAEENGTSEWGSLRDAFSITGMDIHTWTALSMMGKNPLELFGGLEGEAVVKELKRWKKELGDKRQTGKVGNLSLLYAMQTQGLVDAAAKNYNIHWTFEEADKVRDDWLAAYVEIDLWHAWTELTPVDSILMPDVDRGGKISRKSVFASYTLGDRLIYAFGLNAALSYEDQSTGADILGMVMDTLHNSYPDIFDCIINQVHDELVFEVPAAVEAEYTDLIGRIMNECAEHFLMQFGVRGECSPAVGDVWLKD